MPYERNAQAALAWVHNYGVLGLGRNPTSTFAVAGNLGHSSTQIAAELLGVPHLGHGGTRAYRMSAEGGKHETVEMFVLEAYEANVVLKLYEAASARTVNVSAISRFMSGMVNDFQLHLLRKYGWAAKTEREVWSQDEDLAKLWALGVVENAVNKKVEQDVYPVLLGERGSYEEGWGFKSLLGAMWLQMRWFMLGDRKEGFCLRCGELFEKRRRNKVYCDENNCGGRFRAAKQYERKKQREKEVNETRKRKQRERRG